MNPSCHSFLVCIWPKHGSVYSEIMTRCPYDLFQPCRSKGNQWRSSFARPRIELAMPVPSLKWPHSICGRNSCFAIKPNLKLKGSWHLGLFNPQKWLCYQPQPFLKGKTIKLLLCKAPILDSLPTVSSAPSQNRNPDVPAEEWESKLEEKITAGRQVGGWWA